MKKIKKKKEIKGIVVGYGRDGVTLRVKVNGNKYPSTYWAGFWRKPIIKF